jgi:hypothetical protein
MTQTVYFGLKVCNIQCGYASLVNSESTGIILAVTLVKNAVDSRTAR